MLDDPTGHFTVFAPTDEALAKLDKYCIVIIIIVIIIIIIIIAIIAWGILIRDALQKGII